MTIKTLTAAKKPTLTTKEDIDYWSFTNYIPTFSSPPHLTIQIYQEQIHSISTGENIFHSLKSDINIRFSNLLTCLFRSPTHTTGLLAASLTAHLEWSWVELSSWLSRLYTLFRSAWSITLTTTVIHELNETGKNTLCDESDQNVVF